MKKIQTILIIIQLICSLPLLAQVFPVNRSILNYRLIGFKIPAEPDVDVYEFEISRFLITDSGTSHEEVVATQKAKTPHVVAEVPEFGQTYTWKVAYYYKGEKKGISETYRFATGYSPYIDTNNFRVNVINNDLNNKDFLIMIDGLRGIFNSDGQPVWYLPDIPGVINEHMGVRDMKLSPFGTITFLAGDKACEIDYNGNVLWQGPNNGAVSGDTTENYHHQLTRLNNGNYMVLGSKTTKRRVPEDLIATVKNTDAPLEAIENSTYVNILFGTIIEYDKEGNVIWSWIADDCFSDADIFSLGNNGKIRTNTHLNAFFLDTVTNHIYTSYRNINRVIKIAYPDGKIEAQYGESISQSLPGHGMFWGQHSCRINKDGQLYLFNNNNRISSNNIDTVSSIVIFDELKASGKLIKRWEYYCDIDTLTKHKTVSGGGVVELNTGDFLVCMGEVNRNFIITRQRKLTWNVLIEKKDDAAGWVPTTNGYRSWPIQSLQEREMLIYSTEH
ncbi:MAG TPA: aryl-sulfate sulfotransferase [Flavipsychrobacter sp.]